MNTMLNPALMKPIRELRSKPMLKLKPGRRAAEPHTSAGDYPDNQQFFDKTSFHIIIGTLLGIIALICVFALWRGHHRSFIPSRFRRCRDVRSRSRSARPLSTASVGSPASASESQVHLQPNPGAGGGGGGGLWGESMIPASGKELWRKTAYLTDLKR